MSFRYCLLLWGPSLEFRNQPPLPAKYNTMLFHCFGMVHMVLDNRVLMSTKSIFDVSVPIPGSSGGTIFFPDTSGGDADALDFILIWCDILRHSQHKPSSILQAINGLNEAFSKGLLSHNNSFAIVMQRSSQDF